MGFFTKLLGVEGTVEFLCDLPTGENDVKGKMHFDYVGIGGNKEDLIRTIKEISLKERGVRVSNVRILRAYKRD